MLSISLYLILVVFSGKVLPLTYMTSHSIGFNVLTLQESIEILPYIYVRITSPFKNIIVLSISSAYIEYQKDSAIFFALTIKVTKEIHRKYSLLYTSLFVQSFVLSLVSDNLLSFSLFLAFID